MNNKAQYTGIKVIFGFIAFIILGSLFLFKWLNDSSQSAIVIGGFTGIEAFFINNMLLWVVLASLLALAIGVIYGTQ